jgi:uncharacterized protein YjiS (DUF1127 family)
MAMTTYDTRRAAASLGGGLAGTIEAVRLSFAKWRLFRRTLAELQSLSNRELVDLGLHRSMVRGIALDAVYGG